MRLMFSEKASSLPFPERKKYAENVSLSEIFIVILDVKKIVTQEVFSCIYYLTRNVSYSEGSRTALNFSVYSAFWLSFIFL